MVFGDGEFFLMCLTMDKEGALPSRGMQVCIVIEISAIWWGGF